METLVTVYIKPSCVQCNATYRALESAGIAYSAVDVSTNDDALTYIKSLGYAQAPVVVAGAEHWSGFRPDKIADIV
ncbi:glutaredoxin-like protein NrdH [Glutamicibacter protophormiae]|uniref:Glutaredoxin-like protein NrdH n=1 Tax=Glutamicibacter protophormiae TaxID=37930 RepID=A0ABS4XVH1_GLUPR|nr:glutaredoxin-like protein NrdH [Glutamicibacter protophormiae]MBP2400506.1 glutaredoxin-like protein NrdH [Glutamicibacter protophormiae]GGM01060.1 NrdH-redoxin [Glutamicibacter protophormiae]